MRYDRARGRAQFSRPSNGGKPSAMRNVLPVAPPRHREIQLDVSRTEIVSPFDMLVQFRSLEHESLSPKF